MKKAVQALVLLTLIDCFVIVAGYKTQHFSTQRNFLHIAYMKGCLAGNSWTLDGPEELVPIDVDFLAWCDEKREELQQQRLSGIEEIIKD